MIFFIFGFGKHPNLANLANLHIFPAHLSRTFFAAHLFRTSFPHIFLTVSGKLQGCRVAGFSHKHIFFAHFCAPCVGHFARSTGWKRVATVSAVLTVGFFL